MAVLLPIGGFKSHHRSPMITMVAILFALSPTPQAVPPQTPLPVTIKVTQDVSLEPYRRDREEQRIRAMLQFFGGGKAVVIRRGQTFQMITRDGQMEGGCRIRFQKGEYELASCWWREGFTDNRSDIFVVVKK